MNLITFSSMWQKVVQHAVYPHGVIITGPRSVIRGEGVHMILEAMMCPNIQSIRSEHHYTLQPESEKSFVAVDRIRDMQRVLGLAKNQDSPYFVIIPDAATLSLSGWNMMLKTLEEPPKGVIFVVFAQQHHQVPVTVRSRMLKFFIHHEGQSDELTPSHETQVTPKAIKDFLESKPTRVEDWDRWLAGLRQKYLRHIQTQQWEKATRILGLFLDTAHILGAKHTDGSINLRYEISALASEYNADMAS